MIPNNELRLGNWVIPVLELQGEDYDFERLPPVMFHWENLFEAHKHYEPIPLTPEILMKCGCFNQSQNQEYWDFVLEVNGDDEIGIVFNGNVGEELEYGLTCFGADLTPPAKVEYLHQLQNLYFSLAGKELNIEP